MKKIYADYHAKGLEVVGISNDYYVTALTSFVLNEQMPWPELFDPKAAADQEWNSITVGPEDQWNSRHVPDRQKGSPPHGQCPETTWKS